MENENQLRDYWNKCDWNIGTLFAHDYFALNLLGKCRDMNIPIPFQYVFGSIPCLFQGGRETKAETLHPRAFYNRILGYNEIGVGCRLTFSNYNLTEEDLKDDVSNGCLELLNQLGEEHPDIKNGVIISSDLLAEHVRENYPTLQLISSQVKYSTETIIGKTDTAEYYNNLFNLYDIVVMSNERGKEDEFLKKIKYPDRVEFIANHRCMTDCPYDGAHHKASAEWNMVKADPNISDDIKKKKRQVLDGILEKCHARRLTNLLDDNKLSPKRIQEMIDMGFIHFKLEGRDTETPVIVRDIGYWIFNPDAGYLTLANWAGQSIY